MTYPATNLQLQFDDATGVWSYTEVAYNYPNPTPPTWQGYTTPDPEFEFAPDTPDTPDTDDDPCPDGYIYDAALKQCVPDPDYNPARYAGEPTGGGDEPEGLHIPSNETKENWIKNADKVITSGEGAGKTGLQNYLNNLSDRGFTKVVDGNLIFKKDNIGSALGAAMIGQIPGVKGKAEVDAKTNKIIRDLQRMGAINAQVTSISHPELAPGGIDKKLSKLTGQDEIGIQFAPEMELSDTAFTFPTYNYQAGTAATDFRPGDYGGFTTPATHPLGKTTFSTWTDYINTMFGTIQPSIQKDVTVVDPATIGTEQITSVTGKTLDQIQNEIAQAKLEKAKADAVKAQAQANIVIDSSGINGGNGTGNGTDGDGYVSSGVKPETGATGPPGYNYPVTPPSGPKPHEYSGQPVGNPMGAQTNKPSKPKVTSGPRPGKKGWKR